MNKYLIGFIAGFIATVILSLLMMLKAQMGLMPEFNVISDFSQFFKTESPIVGWIIHFIIGSIIWGGLFALFLPFLKGAFWIKGIFFGIIAWLLMMVAYMPVMGHRTFAIELGVQVIMATLVLHIIYGFVLGLSYGFLSKKI